MLRPYRIDFHVHTCLSPCGELEMSPEAIIRAAVEKGLDGLAVCDHNSAENVPAVMQAADGSGLTILAGMEVTTKEEVHVLALFDNWRDARRLEETVYFHLDGWNDPETFGWQVVVNGKGEVTGFNPKLLIGATSLALNDLIGGIHRFNGLAVAAHIDRESFSLIGQLGFIPPGLDIDGVELSKAGYLTGTGEWDEIARDYPVIAGSDAHKPSDIAGVFSTLELERIDLAELKLAFKGEKGRRILYGNDLSSNGQNN